MLTAAKSLATVSLLSGYGIITGMLWLVKFCGSISVLGRGRAHPSSTAALQSRHAKPLSPGLVQNQRPTTVEDIANAGRDLYCN